MKRCIFLTCILIAISICLNGGANAQKPKNEKKVKVDSIPLTGYVYDRLTTREVTKTLVQILHPDSSVVSAATGGYVYWTYDNGGTRKDSSSRYEIYLPRIQGDYIIKVTKEGYEDSYTPYKAEIKSRINALTAPKIYISRQRVNQLQELTVRSSKIKVYHKGDTLIYNAAAFNLPEGSMLDALVQQMPGVEVKGNEIYVNGRFVESLLLNGKEFFKGDPSVAMHNIGAYTVKDVAVYEKAEESAAILGDRDDVKKDYVMDVRLKKDYMTGTAVNADAGYGTKGSYLGRLFGLAYTNNSRLSAYGNTNNINISDRLDENGERRSYLWDSGITSRLNGGIDYNVDNSRHTWEVSGNVDVHYRDGKDHETTNAMQYLQTADNYIFTDKSSRQNNLEVSTSHDINLKHDKWNLYLHPTFTYNKQNSHSDLYSATFNEEYVNMDKEIVKNLYKGDYVNYTTSLINRIVKLYDDDSHGYRSELAAASKIKIPDSPDAIELKGNIRYNRNSVHGMTWQDMCFGNQDGLGLNPVSSLLQQQNQATHPDYNFRLLGLARYYFTLPFGSANLSYEYIHTQARKDASLMLLESMAQGTMAEFQPGQLWMPDFANSYEGKTYKNQHHLKLIWKVKKKYEKGTLEMSTEPSVYLDRHDLFYNQGGIFVDPSKTFVRFKVENTQVRWTTKDNKFRFTLSYKLDQTAPDLLKMVDIPNTSDPMNIWIGNPNLKKATNHGWVFSMYSRSKRISQGAYFRGNWTDNAFVNGYKYMPATGVKEMKTYNVNGINRFSISHWIDYKLDKEGEWRLNNSFDANVNNYCNMIGYDAEPTSQKARNWNLYESLRFSMDKWETKNVTVYTSGHLNWNRSISYSSLPIRSNFGRYGAEVGTYLKFPLNFSFNTSFEVEKYFGYIDNAMNRTRCLWKAELGYSIMKGALRFSVTGTDLLNQMGRLKMTADATGRTQTDELTLGRIILFKVAYKFHHKPKRDKK